MKEPNKENMNEEITLGDEQTPDELLAEMQAESTLGETEDSADTLEVLTEKYKIADLEFDSEADALAVIEAGRKAKELERASTQRFMEASEERKAIEAEKARLGDMQTIWDAWENGTPQQRQYIVQQLSQSAGITESTDNVSWEGNEELLSRQNIQLQNRIDALEAKLMGISPILEDVRSFTNTEKESRQMISDIAIIKEKTGHDVSADQIRQWKENGITDPVKAIEVIKPLLQNAISVGAQKARGKTDEIPAQSKNNVFDPNDPDMTPDEMLRHIMAGHSPSV